MAEELTPAEQLGLRAFFLLVGKVVSEQGDQVLQALHLGRSGTWQVCCVIHWWSYLSYTHSSLLQ